MASTCESWWRTQTFSPVHYTMTHHKTTSHRASVPFNNSWFLKIYAVHWFHLDSLCIWDPTGGQLAWTGSPGAALWPTPLSSSRPAQLHAHGVGRGVSERASLFHRLVVSHLLPSHWPKPVHMSEPRQLGGHHKVTSSVGRRRGSPGASL